MYAIRSYYAGLLGGDIFESEYVFKAESDVKIVSQSYEKVFNTEDKKVIKKTLIHAQENTLVKFMPYPLIPFANSNFESNSEVFVDKSATLLYCDIFNRNNFV